MPKSKQNTPDNTGVNLQVISKLILREQIYHKIVYKPLPCFFCEEINN